MSPKPLIKPYEITVGPHESPLHEHSFTERRYIQGSLPLKGVDEDLPPLKGQLLKWIGNKQKFAREIISYFPQNFGTYYEPFLGSGAVLAHLAPRKAIASDAFAPLIQIWRKLHDDTDGLIRWYSDRYALVEKMGKVQAYESVKAAYNSEPNGADLLFLSRVCYGGVVRFRKADGYMSTPCGPHRPMPPSNFAERAKIWAARTKNTEFVHSDFELIVARARDGDLCYFDPPYADSQTIIYGAQSFDLERLFRVIAGAKERGVRIALSLDGTKKSGNKRIALPFPQGLFKREVFVHLGRSMLRRFQMDGQTLETEVVTDRLLLTY
jgi:DNA adenine methylase